MRAFVLTGPRRSEIQELPDPVPGPGEVVVEVARVGLCGTDVEFFTGEMEYLRLGHSAFPMVLGHEWCGTVRDLGVGVPDRWRGLRVTGDTMLGCGTCDRCRGGRAHVCAARSEIGIRGDYPGALAELLRVPAHALLELPAPVDDTAGAMVEPGGNALRALDAAGVRRGERLLVVGTGTIGLLVAELAAARGVQVCLLGLEGPSLEFARSLEIGTCWTWGDLPPLTFHAVVDAANDAEVPARVVRLVEPGRRVVLIGLSGTPSLIDTREIALRDLTVVGILGASAGLAGSIAAYRDGLAEPRRLVAAVLGLGQAHDALAGWRPDAASAAPKLQIDPHLP